MANRLEMATSQAILALWQRGWSVRRIARELGVNRETVGRYVRLGEAGLPANPANAPTGSDGGLGAVAAHAPTGSGDGQEANPANAPTGSSEGLTADPAMASTGSEGSAAGRRSECEPWRAIIEPMLEVGLSAQRMYQDLVSDHGYGGSYYSVRRFVRSLGRRTELPMRRLEGEPGAEAQVDFGTGAPVLREGKRRRTHVFRIVLSFSRKGYSEVVFRQTTDEFLACLENAFAHFGGVPRTLVIDNLRAAVTHPDWFDPQLCPKVQSWCQHHGTTILPTRPYTPRHKGKIERGIGYVKENALKNRTFTSLAEQNQHLLR